ncbi:hypothetical protein JMJ35_003833 [Cladonia borealis]|uniref:Uncharacterized protein n=1 Tax=Cladonia borealis TaxID=184061 RepID=A0AA39R4W5_9LECA|nr:hypothetical protein JMJ35_003833 [Cladonia borealis]
MSSIRQNTSSSTLSTSSTNSHSSSSSCSSNTPYSNAAHPASEPIPQHLEPVHHRSSTSKSAQKTPNISTTAKSSPSPSPSPHHHHNPTHSEPLIHPAQPKSSAKHNKKAPRGCMAQFDFTYSGLYVSGSQYGRKTLGTGTGAGGSGECGIM